MSELIYKNDGNPFATELAAKMAIGKKKLDAKAVKVDGGYAVEVWGDNKTPTEATPPAQPTKESELKQGEESVQTKTETPDVKVTETWRPKNATEIPEEYKDPDFDYKFEYNHKRAISDNLRNRWAIDLDVAPQMRKAGLLFADGSCDSTFVVGDTILMKLPKVRATARRKYYQERTMDGMKRKKAEYDAKLRDCGVEGSVGDGIKVSRGIAG